MATMLESPSASTDRATTRRAAPRHHGKNVGGPERLASVAGGGILALAGLKRGGVGGALTALAGAALVQRGVTGRCAVYGTLGLSSSREDTGRRLGAPDRVPTFDSTVRVKTSITIARPAEELYHFWRDFRNAPRYRENIAQVRMDSPTRSHWVMTGPGDRTWEWDSELTLDREGRGFAWESLEGADLPNRGSVEFLPDARGEETVVTYEIEFDPPGGVIGAAVANVFHEVPEQMVRADLRRFKALMETGEIPTTNGQPSCRGRDD